MADQPYELETWQIVPALRRELLSIMMKKGLTQKECAEKLMITPAAVSQYKNSKRAKEIKFPKSFDKELELSVKRILKDPLNNHPEIRRLTSHIDVKKIICTLHKKSGSAPKNCCICLK